MIHTFECRSCGGTYAEASSNGAPYTHICGPLPMDKHGVERERPNKRDENVVIDSQGRTLGIRSEGDGVRCLTDVSLEEPTWISAVYKRIAAREEKENA